MVFNLNNTYYTVQAGDSLHKIFDRAKQKEDFEADKSYSQWVDNLVKTNQVGDPNEIDVGDKISVSYLFEQVDTEATRRYKYVDDSGERGLVEVQNHQSGNRIIRDSLDETYIFHPKGEKPIVVNEILAALGYSDSQINSAITWNGKLESKPGLIVNLAGQRVFITDFDGTIRSFVKKDETSYFVEKNIDLDSAQPESNSVSEQEVKVLKHGLPLDLKFGQDIENIASDI